MKKSLLLIFLFSKTSFAAPCCGGGYSSPQIILSGHTYQVSTSYNLQRIDRDVSYSGIWNKRSSKESYRSLKLDLAFKFRDYHHFSLSSPWIERKRNNLSESGFGDTVVSYAYEYQEDTLLLPRMIGFIQLHLPSGKSIHEANAPFLLDTRGMGYTSFGLGNILIKNWQKVDVYLSFVYLRGINSTVNDKQILPSWRSSVESGLGYSIDFLRLGTSLKWNYKNPDSIKMNDEISKANLERYIDLGFDLSYLYKNIWSFKLAYYNNYLLGSPVNTALGSSYTFAVQRRW